MNIIEKDLYVGMKFYNQEKNYIATITKIRNNSIDYDWYYPDGKFSNPAKKITKNIVIDYFKNGNLILHEDSSILKTNELYLIY